MISEIYTKKYNDFPFDRQEILRYAGCKGADEDSEMVRVMDKCISELSGASACTFNVSYRVLPVKRLDDEGGISFSLVDTRSKDISSCLENCDRAVFMAATAGHGIDLLIRRYARLDPVKALFLQAIGAERVEALCDGFCQDLPELLMENIGISDAGQPVKVRPRFSPGYGDLPLALQTDFMRILEMNKRLGITLNESLLMSPSKSVTAIVGILNS